MGDQQFFLKWNDFQTNMVTSFRHLRDEKSFTDVSVPYLLVLIASYIFITSQFVWIRDVYIEIDVRTENN